VPLYLNIKKTKVQTWGISTKIRKGSGKNVEIIIYQHLQNIWIIRCEQAENPVNTGKNRMRHMVFPSYPQTMHIMWIMWVKKMWKCG